MILESVLTAVITVIVGVLVYSFSQIASRFIFEPIHRQDEIRGEIADSLIFYANVYANPGTASPQLTAQASDKFRQLASLLMSRTCLIRVYGFFSWLGLIPGILNLMKAHGNLIGLSNNVSKPGSSTQNVQWAEEIKRLLKI